MTNMQTIPVTAALRNDYALMRALVSVTALEWIVVMTNPACEERAMASLSAEGLIVYRPMEPVVRKRGRTAKSVDASRAFFPRYVFVALDRAAGQYAEMVRTCDGVENILSFHLDHSPHIVPARQMRVIMEAAFEAQTNKNYQVPQSFSIGEKILITTRHFTGLEAVVSSYEDARGRVVTEAEMLGQRVKMIVPVDKCRKAG